MQTNHQESRKRESAGAPRPAPLLSEVVFEKEMLVEINRNVVSRELIPEELRPAFLTIPPTFSRLSMVHIVSETGTTVARPGPLEWIIRNLKHVRNPKQLHISNEFTKKSKIIS